eukprot:6484059-Amphidinium_carterae.2
MVNLTADKGSANTSQTCNTLMVMRLPPQLQGPCSMLQCVGVRAYLIRLLEVLTMEDLPTWFVIKATFAVHSIHNCPASH